MIGEMDDYWERRTMKLANQAEKAETNLFRGLVFYILGFNGRGEDSRYHMTKVIERNGGRTCMMISSHTTHVIARSICHSKRTMLDKAIEKRKIFVVSQDFLFDCIKQNRILDPEPYMTSKQKAKTITSFFPQDKAESIPTF